VLALTAPLGTSPAWSFYAVQELVWPAFGFDSSLRAGVPFAPPAMVAGSDTVWGGTTSSAPGWEVTAGAVSAGVPWPATNNVPTLIAVYWSSGELRVYLENVAGETASASGSAGPTSFASLGGLLASMQPTPTAGLLLSELIYYAEVLSSDNDTSILDYLREKWLTAVLGITTESGDPIATETTVGPTHPDSLITETDTID